MKTNEQKKQADNEETDMSTATPSLRERAEAARCRIMDGCVLSLYGESGDDGIFSPATPIEGAYARYWTDEQYSWTDMVDDLPADDIMEGGATAVLSGDDDRLISAAHAIDDDDLTEAVVAYVRRHLLVADADENHGIRQAACDAVDWESVDGAVLDYLRGDIEADALAEADVRELERIAPCA